MNEGCLSWGMERVKTKKKKKNVLSTVKAIRTSCSLLQYFFFFFLRSDHGWRGKKVACFCERANYDALPEMCFFLISDYRRLAIGFLAADE